MANYRIIKHASFAWTIIGITLITGLVEIVMAEDFQIDQYLGCFYDGETQPGAQLRSPGFSNAALTIDICIQHCRNKGVWPLDLWRLWSYAILQNGTDCGCSNNYGGNQVQDSFCNRTCGGNVSHVCGGTYENGNSVYVLYAVCPIGTYGLMCSETCHCKSQVPCDRQSGRCPDGCHGKYTGANCSQLTSFSDQYIGCYRDNNDNRVMEKQIDLINKNTLQLCLDLCSSNYSYAGPQFGYECWCGESYDKHGRIDERFCNSTCSVNARQFCGGAGALSVYDSCPADNYGLKCAKVCNCEGRCHFKNGTCLNTTCKPGWTGDACNIRDCTNNNGSCASYEICIEVEPITSLTMTVCRCQSGYWRNRVWGDCVDIDECLEIPNICGPFAKSCNNTEGGYTCYCTNGTIVQNTVCLPDIDECLEIPNICGSFAISCNNTEGGYTCHCTNGTVVQNSACIPDAKYDKEHAAINVGIVVGAVVGSFCLFLIAVLIIAGILYSRKSRLPSFGTSSGNENQRHNPTATSVGMAKGTSSECEARLYDCIAAVYDVSSPVRTVGTEELPSFVLSKLSTPGLLDKEFKSVPKETKEPCNVGRHRNMKAKNRFKNVIPYDHNRVVLERKDNNVLSDYINASYVTSYSSSEKIIATQGPKPATVNDFWRMVVEQDVAVIVVITNLMENLKAKCEKYWPEAGCNAIFGEVQVKSQSEDHWSEYTARKLLVTSNEKTLNVVQWHFLPWPDHGIPSDSNSFLNFHRRIRNSMTSEKSMVVHCSAGVGRTGCFIAIDYLLQQGKTEGRIDILGCLQQLREMRCQMVQTLDQYQFIHRALLFSFTVGETAIPNSKFASTVKELQRVNSTKGRSPLDAQYQILTDPNQDMAGICFSRAPTKAVNKNRVAMLDPAFTWGWKTRDAYLSLISPTSETVQDFYALCNEYKCKAIILIDPDKVLDGAVFPSSQEIKLQGQIISCMSSSKEDFGTAYKMTERRGADDTYANFGQVDNVYANAGGGADKREFSVLHVNESLTDEAIGFLSLFSLLKNLRSLNEDRSNTPVVVISKQSFGLSAFCLAALNAFQMSADEKEVDVYQIVQEIRKSRKQFDISLSAFKELHSIVDQFIENSRGSFADFC